jgi:hypothetical protein
LGTLGSMGGTESASTGKVVATGGVVGTGGTAVASTGGAVATGGNATSGTTANGGTAATGGSQSGSPATTGGSLSSGGTASAGTGGGPGTGHTTVGAALSKVETALCSRITVCLGDTSSASACYNNLVSLINVSPVNAIKTEACTNSEMDVCINDIGIMACPASTATVGSVLSNLPASCQSC